MSAPTHFDFLVIGGGSAGYAAASTAARLGLKTAVVEGGKHVGGLCILRGCMPSKTLLASANRAHAIREASEFGLHAQLLRIDAPAIQERKRRLIDDFASYRKSQLESGRFTFLRGHAAFSDAHTIELKPLPNESPTEESSLRISASAFLVATGSAIAPPPLPSLNQTGFLDSDTFLESKHIPSSVTVLGGGAIALEAATFYAQLGSEVSLIQRSPRILKEADPDVSEALEQGLKKLGVQIFTNTRLLDSEQVAGQKRVHFEKDGAPQFVDAEEIVCATGRVPATDGLGLEAVGVKLSRGRIQTAFTQQSSVPHIFAAGDVCGPVEVVHLAITQGEIAARNAHRILRGGTESMETMDYRLKMLAVFSEPGCAFIGITEAEAQKHGVAIRTASYPFADHGKSMVEARTDGFVKLIVAEKSREILGAAVVGPEAAELIHEVAVAMAFHATAGQFAKVPHYHPTLSEIWTYPAEDLAE